MATTTKTYDIHDIARAFDRLFPDQVDDTPTDWGNGTQAGHIGHDHEDEPSSIGWFCGGGNAGHPVMSIENDDIQRAGEVLAGLKVVGSLEQVERAFKVAGVRFERLV